MAKIGGGAGICDDNDAFARVYNNLLLHEYIYYFTPVHLLTCCLPYFSILIYQLSLHANSAELHRDAFLSQGHRGRYQSKAHLRLPISYYH